jgi:hypothetical protein
LVSFAAGHVKKTPINPIAAYTAAKICKAKGKRFPISYGNK